MNCISFPNMFLINNTKVLTAEEATKKCLYLLLNSESGEMFGDPEFGVKLRKYFFDQNNHILRDILIDELYVKISIFCPQIIISRKDIKLEQVNKKIIGRIQYRYNINFVPDTYDIVLFEGE